MTKLEREIVEILREDSRRGAEQIAVMLGETKECVERTIKELEQRGIIVKYAAIIDYDEEEDGCVEALIEVKVTPQTGEGFDGIAEEIAQHEEVKGLYLMSGAYDFAVLLEGRSVRSVARFISECISTFASVNSTATHFILKKYKIEGARVQRKPEEGRRLFVQP